MNNIILLSIVFATLGSLPLVDGALLPLRPDKVQQQDESASVDLNKAREKSKLTQARFEAIKRLREKGSASGKDLRRAELARDLALLELSDQLDPNRQHRNNITKAKLVLHFRSEELRTVKRLYRKGSASSASYRRVEALLEIAQLNLKIAESSSEAQKKLMMIKIATVKLELIRQEHETARRLVETGSISQSEFDESVAKLKIALAELEAARKNLGARAVEVRQ